MSDRGDYRSWFASILDDPDFQTMEGEVFKALFALKHHLGATGISVMRKLVLMDQLKISEAELERRLAALEAPKTDSETGWIVRDRTRSIVWLVNGLKFEPTITSENAKHRSYVERLTKPLGERSIVGEFRQYYRSWFPDWSPPKSHSDGSPIPIEGVSNGNANPIGRVTDHKRQATSDVLPATITSDKRQEDASDRPNQPRGRFLEKFYHDATPERRKEVLRQLDQALTPEGASVRKGHAVRANSPEHLNRVLSAVLREQPPRNPDRAIVIVLLKLEDPEKDSRGHTVTEAASARHREEDRLLDRWDKSRQVAVESWMKSHVREAEQIERMVEASVPIGDIGREMAIHGKLMQELTKAAGFPPFEKWREANQSQNQLQESVA